MVAPAEPPDPPAPVIVPELYAAQTVVPFAGEATPSVGAIGVEDIVIIRSEIAAQLPTILVVNLSVTFPL